MNSVPKGYGDGASVQNSNSPGKSSLFGKMQTAADSPSRVQGSVSKWGSERFRFSGLVNSGAGEGFSLAPAPVLAGSAQTSPGKQSPASRSPAVELLSQKDGVPVAQPSAKASNKTGLSLKPVPEWLDASTPEEREMPLSLAEVNKVLAEFAGRLTKDHYRALISRLKVSLAQAQNQDAVKRSKVFHSQTQAKALEQEIGVQKLVLERMNKQETKDKQYIALQEIELAKFRKEELAQKALLEEQERQRIKSLLGSGIEGSYKIAVERFEVDLAKREQIVFAKINEKEAEIIALLEKIKALKEEGGNRRFFSQNALNESVKRALVSGCKTSETVMPIKLLDRQLEIQDLKMKVFLALGELEALKADLEFETLETKLAMTTEELEKARIAAGRKAQRNSEELERFNKAKFDLAELYKNQSPLFDFMSSSKFPKSFYVEHKEVVNPREWEFDPSCIKHNEHFKQTYMAEKSLGSTIGSRSASPKAETKNFMEMNKQKIKEYTKKAGSENGDKKFAVGGQDDSSLSNSHFSVPGQVKELDFRKPFGKEAGKAPSPIKIKLEENNRNGEFLGQGGTLPTPASGHGMKKRGEATAVGVISEGKEESAGGRGLGRSQSPVDPRLKQVVSSVMAEVNRSIEAHKIQAERRQALRQQK